jgi:hypothetical protein
MNTNEVSIPGSATAHRTMKVATDTAPAINRRLLAMLEAFSFMSVPHGHGIKRLYVWWDINLGTAINLGTDRTFTVT